MTQSPSPRPKLGIFHPTTSPLAPSIFSLAASLLIGVGVGVLHVRCELAAYSAVIVMIGLLFYVWAAHFWAQQRYAFLAEELARIRTKLEGER